MSSDYGRLDTYLIRVVDEELDHLLPYLPAISLDDGLKRFAAWVGTQPLPEDRSQAANAELQARKLMG